MLAHYVFRMTHRIERNASRWNVTLKWIDTIFGSHRSPNPKPTLANTHVHITLMLIGIQNIPHIWYNLQSFSFSINGDVPIPLFGGPLDLWVQDYLWQYCLLFQIISVMPISAGLHSHFTTVHCWRYGFGVISIQIYLFCMVVVQDSWLSRGQMSKERGSDRIPHLVWNGAQFQGLNVQTQKWLNGYQTAFCPCQRSWEGT